MKKLQTIFAVSLVTLLGWTAESDADGRRGRGGRDGFRGHSGGHFNGHRNFHGHNRHFHGHRHFHGNTVIVTPFWVGPTYTYAPPPVHYWYYCRSAGAYYPYVPACPEPWVPVRAN